MAGEVDRTQYKNEKYFDASLSPDGWQQAEALGRHVRAVGLQPELVVVSPLTRALQTASGGLACAHLMAASLNMQVRARTHQQTKPLHCA